MIDEHEARQIGAESAMRGFDILDTDYLERAEAFCEHVTQFVAYLVEERDLHETEAVQIVGGMVTMLLAKYAVHRAVEEQGEGEGRPK